MKKISLLIFSLFMSIGWGQCSGCNTLFNFCNEILDNYNFCSPIDIDILEEIVVLNNLDIELVYLGYQEWVSGRLKNFILINNNIIELPNSFGGLTSLEGLDLEFNSIITLPESIGDLSSLKYLDISSNKIWIALSVVPIGLSGLIFRDFIAEEAREIAFI